MIRRLPPRLDTLLSRRGVWLFWLTYGICFATVRYVASGNLSKDDARENELVQSLALGYQARQPPLFEWILWTVQQFTGPGIASHLLVRYTLILAIGLAAFAATRAITHDPRWSAAASLSYAFAGGFVGWLLHEWLTQSVLLAVACIASLCATLAFLRKPSTAAAIVLGLGIGFGLMSKFNYVLYLGGLVLAVASLPEVRTRLLDWRLLVSSLVATACCVPYLWWLAAVHGDAVGTVVQILTTPEEPHVVRALLGLGSLAASLVHFLGGIWWVLMAILCWPGFFPARDGQPPAPIAERIAGRSVVIAIVLGAIVVVAIGADILNARYMVPLLVTVPIWVCARTARLAPEERRPRRVAVTAVSGAALFFALRLVTFFDVGLSPIVSLYHAFPEFREFTVPYDGLAAKLRAHGVTEGTLVTAGIREAGNMRAYLPRLRVMSGDSSRGEPPPRRAGEHPGCVLLWREGDERDQMRRWAQQDLGSAVRLNVTTSTVWGVRHGVWYILPVDPRLPICA